MRAKTPSITPDASPAADPLGTGLLCEETGASAYSRKESGREISPGVRQRWRPASLPSHHSDKMPQQKPLKLFLLSFLHTVMVLMNVQADALKTSTIPKRQANVGSSSGRPHSKAIICLQAVMGKCGDLGKCGITSDLRAGKITVTS